MIHTVYLVMMLTNGVPQQMSAESTPATCQSIIEQFAGKETGERRHFWYCQPVVAPGSLGPK